MGLGAVSRLFTTFALRYFLPRRAYIKKQFEDVVSRSSYRYFDIRETRLSLEVEMRK